MVSLTRERRASTRFCLALFAAGGLAGMMGCTEQSWTQSDSPFVYRPDCAVRTGAPEMAVRPGREPVHSAVGGGPSESAPGCEGTPALIPRGTPLAVRFDEELNARNVAPGETVVLKTLNPLRVAGSVRGAVVVPAASTVTARVTGVESGAPGSSDDATPAPATIRLQAISIETITVTMPIAATVLPATTYYADVAPEPRSARGAPVIALRSLSSEARQVRPWAVETGCAADVLCLPAGAELDLVLAAPLRVPVPAVDSGSLP